MSKTYIDVKKIKKETKLVDTWMPAKYATAPYRACGHACKYCDGRAEKYYVDGNFEKDIVIRKNLPIILDTEIPKFKEKGFLMFGSGVTDAYQPIEKDEKITLRSAEILLKHKQPGKIHTKSALPLRDFDIWKELHQNAGFHLDVTIITHDDEVRKIFEPGASSISKRFEMIRKFKEVGISVGVFIMPLLPLISDDNESIEKLLQKLAELKVDFVCPGGLTLRPGIQKEIFLQVIKKHYPQHLKRYIQFYQRDLQSGSPPVQYRDDLHKRFNILADKYNLPQFMPHKIYRNIFPLYDEIYLLLQHMRFLFFLKKIDTSRLDNAVKRYKNWLLDEKKWFNRQRKSNHLLLEEKFMNLLSTGMFINIIKNEKLTNFISKVVLDRKIFSYNSLEFL